MAKAKNKPEAAVEVAPGAVVVLVKMQRDGKTADVHPLEVENYRAGGWQLIEN